MKSPDFTVDRRTLLSGLAGASSMLAASGAAAQTRAAPSPSGDRRGKPGPRNLITDVAGITVGQADSPAVRTGVTVIVPDKESTAAVDVRGGGPGTRETDALDAYNLVHAVDAIVLSGGSVYGLAAADGVCAWLGANNRGYSAMAMPGVPKSPIVPAAILFDLPNGGDKNWGLEPPYRALGIKAVQNASQTFALGTAGAGYGAGAGSLKGGTGSASVVTFDGMTVGAIVAVNSLGSVIGPDGKGFWAAPFEMNSEFGGLAPPAARIGADDWGSSKASPAARQNTTIACVATDVELTPDEMKRVVMMAQDGLPRAIRPIHSPFDGDVVFGISTGKRPAPEPRAFTVARIGALAADTLTRAVARGVFEATNPPGAKTQTWKSLRG